MGPRVSVLLIILVAIVQIFFSHCLCSAAGSSSENYSIPTSVLSGGGGAMGSAGFRGQGTLGQPSPMMDPADPPYSDAYGLYPGFWYTLEAAVGCDLASFAAAFGTVSGEPGYNPGCDAEPDGDVDGVDLAQFAAGYWKVMEWRGDTGCAPRSCGEGASSVVMKSPRGFATGLEGCHVRKEGSHESEKIGRVCNLLCLCAACSGRGPWGPGAPEFPGKARG